MNPQKATGNQKAENKLSYLKPCHRPLPPPPPPPPNAGRQIVTVHCHVYSGVGDEGHRKQRLSCGEPDVAHEDDDGVVVDVEEGEALAASEEDEGGVDELVDFGEVEDLGPEEDGAGGGGGGRKAEEPSKGGHLGEGGDRAADGHDGREEEEEEVMDGGEEAEEGGGEGGESKEAKVEEEGEGEVGEDGGEEEGEGRGKGFVGNPFEGGDCRQVDEISPEKIEKT
ncbi:hypothetical protein M5K25_023541 [Dendrobium thyrsiflorum]|uniref:Uncharacterized protein n=1 Tax=Dendrobium thyrsiflorum TaxID=117978 RepID=A0ABD0U8B1_DENTH